MKRMKFLLASAALVVGIGVSLPTEARNLPPIPSGFQTVVNNLSDRFVTDMKLGGIHGVAEDVDSCYALAEGSSPVGLDKGALRRCMILDAAAFEFNGKMQQVFQAHGVDTSSAAIQYFMPQSFWPRQQMYESVTYGGDTLAYIQVIEGLGVYVEREVMERLSKTP